MYIRNSTHVPKQQCRVSILGYRCVCVNGGLLYLGVHYNWVSVIVR